MASIGDCKAGRTYSLMASLVGLVHDDDRITVSLCGCGDDRITKVLHPGDPDFYLPYRPDRDGQFSIILRSRASLAGSRPRVMLEWREIRLAAGESPAIEAEPNDSWRRASPLVLGRDVYGTADDVDYLDNQAEGKAGLDWFRFEVAGPKPALVYFQLDLLDRDVSANLRVLAIDPRTGRLEPYANGKDPMEIVHDRERERYSKHISRTFAKGTYYLEVNANHPDYILRTRVLPVPPYEDPATAVEAGMHYIINVGDAWFAQIPREGNIYVRADNLHDTATRCTACHPSSFSTEANLVAHRNGYPIRSKSNFQYVMDRIANSMTPLYGDGGLNWQRFIAIPLQAQGKQGGILADFEREVAGKETAMVERFGPFLKAAWEGRKDMPADELNGVVPLDSKFGLAWRDRAVLGEIARRTGRADYAQAAETIARIVGTRSADLRVETFQDRIHRLFAWGLIDKARFADKIKRETGALLALQNPDGGWHEVDSKPGPSAVYTTGQLVYTLLELGEPPTHPALARALHYLLAQQQDFGGWFQTTTHENFRTPMRETRYAVMALARAFPRPGAPLRSWGNRDDGQARPPRGDSLLHTLDDLENLWDVPAADRDSFARSIVPLLNHPERPVRASAAACLGRLGSTEAVDPLVKGLSDPSKIVWRASAWALRRLGNQGVGVEAIKAALADRDPAIRRGAARIFAYQFHGMDERLELADRLIERTGDPDLWTRLQALKTLRQWFYRTRDERLQSRIIATYLARMAMMEAPVIRKNLSEGLYIMLDENLGGGTSLQNNLKQLPEASGPKVLEARKAFERNVLLPPVLTALEGGSSLQRQAVLEAFDGSFFKGRYFARQPENMIDVGNDREFGFLHDPPLDQLERMFASLLRADLPSASRRQVIQLCRFFKLPGRTRDVVIQLGLLEALVDPEPGVAEEARAAVGELTLARMEDNPTQVTRIVRQLHSCKGASRAALLAAIGRNGRLGSRPGILKSIRELIAHGGAEAELLPVLNLPEINDAELVAVLEKGWDRFAPAQRLAALDLLFGRPQLLDVPEPPEPALSLIRRAQSDTSSNVRERALAGLSGLPKFWAGRNAGQLLLTTLADDTPAIRRRGLTLASSKGPFWDRPDAREHLARLLVDPDSQVRSQSLEILKHHRLLDRAPTLARRVKALTEDRVLGTRAEAALRAAGQDPARIAADASLARPRLLSLASFRRNVNPLFYATGDDTYSCAKCHANHTILRISGAESSGAGDAALITNYNSALKVVNPGNPESSLLLRKPRSPQGQGNPDPSSPTGLTHVGGARWDGTDHPAYRAILGWIREASSLSGLARVTAIYHADSYAPGHEASLAADGDISTCWRTEFVGAMPGYPHDLVVDLGTPARVEGLLYIPRQDDSQGRVREYEVQLSADGKTWFAPIASGRWADDPTFKHVALPGTSARFVRLRGLSEVNGLPFMSVAELAIEATP